MWFILLSILAMACAQTIDTLSVTPVSASSFMFIGRGEGQTFLAPANGPIQVTVRFSKTNPANEVGGGEAMISELLDGEGFGGAVLQAVTLPNTFFDGLGTSTTDSANERTIEFDSVILNTGQRYTWAIRNSLGAGFSTDNLQIMFSNADPYADGERWFNPGAAGGEAATGDDLIILIEPLGIFPQE
jgi:hypothetical protein